jgi:hypothetical protein
MSDMKKVNDFKREDIEFAIHMIGEEMAIGIYYYVDSQIANGSLKLPVPPWKVKNKENNKR